MPAEPAAAPATPRPRRRRRLPSFAPVYFAAVTLPPLMIYFSIAASQTAGFLLAALFILARGQGALPGRWPMPSLVPAVLALVLVHFLVAASFQPVDAVRATLSLVPLTLLLVTARHVAALLPALPPQRLHRDVVRCFLWMCALAVLAVLGIQPPSVEEWRKSVFPFFEPAVFALPFVPVLMYATISATGRRRLGYLALGIGCTALIQNLTLATCFLLVAGVSFRWRTLAIVAIPLALGGAQLDLTYYAERLDFSGEGQNLSNLVYVQGWQMIGESWSRSSGFGLGFQQLGARGTDVPAAELIRALREGEDLNVLDGGFVLSKLTGEFGVFGLSLALAFLALAFRSFRALRRIALGREPLVPHLALAHCSVLGYSIELLVRGGSYFTGTTMLLIASLWLLHRQRAAAAQAAPRRRRKRRAVPRPAGPAGQLP